MHTNEISRMTGEMAKKVSAGEVAPETAKAVAELIRGELSNWRARMEYARHHATVVKIAELEPRIEIAA